MEQINFEFNTKHFDKLFLFDAIKIFNCEECEQIFYYSDKRDFVKCGKLFTK